MTDATRPLDVVLVGINYGPEHTGIAPYTQGMAEALVRRGHRVRVVTSYPSYPAWRVADGYTGLSRRERIGGVDVQRLRTVVPAEPTPVRRALMELVFGLRAAACRYRGTDVVVCVSPALISTAVVQLRLRAGRRSPAVGVWVQDLYGLGVRETGQAGGLAGRAVGLLERVVMRAADGVAVIHQRFADQVSGEMGVPAPDVVVVPNWSHIARADHSTRGAVRAGMGWSDDETVVLHAGNMGVKQGLESVVEAARLAEGRAERVRFVFLGDGNRRSELERLAAGCSRVQFVDPVDDAAFPNVLAAADVLLLNELPSLAEMCVPSKLTSYFATGRPVVAATSADGVSAGVVREAGAGLVVRPGDPEALLAGVAELAADPGRSRRFGEYGLAYCAGTLGADRSVDAVEAWLGALDGRRPAAGTTTDTRRERS